MEGRAPATRFGAGAQLHPPSVRPYPLAEVPIADLHKLGAEALKARGYTKDESAVCSM